MAEYPSKHDVFAALPPPWPHDVLPQLHDQIQADGRTVVVLDDDPTGTQTVHGVPVLTTWSVDALRAELQNDLPACYILTNTRSMPLEQAQAINAEIGHNLVQAAQESGRRFAVVSRSDSTLRGHFPGEVAALAGTLGERFDAWLLMPFFGDGGRYTINDVQYVADGDRLVPAGDTAFARDASFGYRASNLRAWVEEKTAGRTPESAVASITLADIRIGGPQRVAECLLQLAPGSVCIVNAATMHDVAVFTSGLLGAEAKGQRFLPRTAASFVPVRAGIGFRPLLERSDLNLSPQGGGLIVVGSYVLTTSAQLAGVLRQPHVASVEVEVAALLDDRNAGHLAHAIKRTNDLLRCGQDVVVHTSRVLVTGADAARSLQIGQRVSAALVAIVRGVTTRPRYILAKGGITSSDVATSGLDVRRALVLGQIAPGVPCWQLGAESRYGGVPYIVFPGNVGQPGTLAEIVHMLRAA
jgi:uncharacterized protein YgbK (DUF1537 family)